MLPVIPSAALLKRELFTSLRRKRTFAALVFMMGTVFLIAVPVLLQANAMLRYQPMMNLQPFVAFLYYAFLVMACLLVPALAGVSICMEKQQGSFDLLATSLIRPVGVVAAKMMNAVGVFVLITIAAFPLLGIAFFFAGFDVVQILIASAIILSAAVACAAAGVLCSTLFYRSTAALTTSYLAMFAVLGVPQWMAIWFLAIAASGFGYGGMPRGLDNFLEFVVESSPVWCPLTGLSTTIDFLSGTFDTLFVVLGVFFQLAIAGGCLALAALVQRRPPKPQKVDSTRPIDDQLVLDLRRKRFPYYLLDPLKRVAEIPDGRNPMYAKERRAGFASKSTHRVRVFYVLAILFFVISMLMLPALDSRGNEEFLGTVLMLEAAFVLLTVPPTVATAVTREFELRNIDMLRITLLRPSQVLLGKTYACLMAVAPVVLAMLIGNAMLYLFVRSPREVMIVFGVIVVMGVSVLLAVSVSLLVSLVCRRQATALVGSYIANLVLFLGLPGGMVFAWMALYQWYGSGRVNDDLLAWLMNAVPSPMIAQVPNIAEIRHGEVWLRWVVNMQVSLGTAIALFFVSVAYFARYRMRER